MNIYALWFTTINGDRKHIQLKGGTEEEANKKFKEIELQLAYSKKPEIMSDKKFYVIELKGN